MIRNYWVFNSVLQYNYTIGLKCIDNMFYILPCFTFYRVLHYILRAYFSYSWNFVPFYQPFPIFLTTLPDPSNPFSTFCVYEFHFWKPFFNWSIVNLQCCVSDVQQNNSVTHTHIHIYIHTYIDCFSDSFPL